MTFEDLLDLEETVTLTNTVVVFGAVTDWEETSTTTTITSQSPVPQRDEV